MMKNGTFMLHGMQRYDGGFNKLHRADMLFQIDDETLIGGAYERKVKTWKRVKRICFVKQMLKNFEWKNRPYFFIKKDAGNQSLLHLFFFYPDLFVRYEPLFIL